MHARTRHNVTMLLAAAILLPPADTMAQGPKGAGPGVGGGQHAMGPGSMMGPGMMGAGRFGFSCHPRAAGMAEWSAARIDEVVKPNDAQKAKLADLKAASAKAAETISAACAAEMPAKSIERFALMEKRLEAMQTAVKTVRPAFEGFYASLDDQQKAKLDTAGPRRWGWINWRWRWSQ